MLNGGKAGTGWLREELLIKIYVTVRLTINYQFKNVIFYRLIYVNSLSSNYQLLPKNS